MPLRRVGSPGYSPRSVAKEGRGPESTYSPAGLVASPQVVKPTVATGDWVSDSALYPGAPDASLGNAGQVWYVDVAHGLGIETAGAFLWIDIATGYRYTNFLHQEPLTGSETTTLRVWLENKPTGDAVIFVC
jgi:hypothetical protein